MNESGKSFVELVKDALEHLYDPVHLRNHPLTSLLVPQELPLGIGPAQALRQVLLDGIERLNFSASLASGAKQNRAHQILVLRYVEALPFREVMAELSLSQPQFHREQRHALEALAALLEEMAETTKSQSRAPSMDPEVGVPFSDLDVMIHSSEGPIDLHDVIEGVSPLLAEVAGQAGVTLRVEDSSSPTVVIANRTALRQLVIGIVGYVLCVASGGELSVRATEVDEVVLQVVYRGFADHAGLDHAEARDRYAVVSRLVTALHGTIATDHTRDSLSVTASLPPAHRTLLVIDDNPDAIQLVARLLADQHYTIVSAHNVQAGLALARSTQLDAILLDIMMPQQDGWDALQTLKHDPATQGIPILVCTVLAEARLALALGAAEFIRKPLTRPRLLEALARWTAVRR